jgi:hypothetical protein
MPSRKCIEAQILPLVVPAAIAEAGREYRILVQPPLPGIAQQRREVLSRVCVGAYAHY